ncbi:hypothetical protein SISNIDRAFT_459051 [Sistotremastrum niveocremeum HHB9708]|uniref:Uncharacterized protein n=1 Tax=Sistotremastrum niveocremeum HHB9708 TaxID=1314777 RepID=A0A164PVR2_9AGAM|nr:hypothetical protein SISNIDRAFT_459051 [Sistotremastrum niveocremeum HHB9708]
MADRDQRSVGNSDITGIAAQGDPESSSIQRAPWDSPPVLPFPLASTYEAENLYYLSRLPFFDFERFRVWELARRKAEAAAAVSSKAPETTQGAEEVKGAPDPLLAPEDDAQGDSWVPSDHTQISQSSDDLSHSTTEPLAALVVDHPDDEDEDSEETRTESVHSIPAVEHPPLASASSENEGADESSMQQHTDLPSPQAQSAEDEPPSADVAPPQSVGTRGSSSEHAPSLPSQTSTLDPTVDQPPDVQSSYRPPQALPDQDEPPAPETRSSESRITLHDPVLPGAHSASPAQPTQEIPSVSPRENLPVRTSSFVGDPPAPDPPFAEPIGPAPSAPADPPPPNEKSEPPSPPSDPGSGPSSQSQTFRIPEPYEIMTMDTEDGNRVELVLQSVFSGTNPLNQKPAYALFYLLRFHANRARFCSAKITFSFSYVEGSGGPTVLFTYPNKTLQEISMEAFGSTLRDYLRKFNVGNLDEFLSGFTSGGKEGGTKRVTVTGSQGILILTHSATIDIRENAQSEGGIPASVPFFVLCNCRPFETKAKGTTRQKDGPDVSTSKISGSFQTIVQPEMKKSGEPIKTEGMVTPGGGGCCG